MKQYSFVQENVEQEKPKTPIHLNPNMAGDFTAKAKAAGMTPLDFAKHVLADKTGKYDTHTRRQAQFVLNASKWHHKKKSEKAAAAVREFVRF